MTSAKGRKARVKRGKAIVLILIIVIIKQIHPLPIRATMPKEKTSPNSKETKGIKTVRRTNCLQNMPSLAAKEAADEMELVKPATAAATVATADAEMVDAKG